MTHAHHLSVDQTCRCEQRVTVSDRIRLLAQFAARPVHMLRSWIEWRRQIRALSDLDDRLLKDIAGGQPPRIKRRAGASCCRAGVEPEASSPSTRRGSIALAGQQAGPRSNAPHEKEANRNRGVLFGETSAR